MLKFQAQHFEFKSIGCWISYPILQRTTRNAAKGTFVLNTNNTLASGKCNRREFANRFCVLEVSATLEPNRLILNILSHKTESWQSKKDPETMTKQEEFRIRNRENFFTSDFANPCPLWNRFILENELFQWFCLWMPHARALHQHDAIAWWLLYMHEENSQSKPRWRTKMSSPACCSCFFTPLLLEGQLDQEHVWWLHR